MLDNRRFFSIQKEDVWAAISVAIYPALIFGLVQAWIHLSDTANAFIILH